MRTVIEIAPGAFFVRSYSEQTIAPFQYCLTTQGILLTSDEPFDIDIQEEKFEPVEPVDIRAPISVDKEIIENWLKLAEDSFDFWDNDLDAVYDNL